MTNNTNNTGNANTPWDEDAIQKELNAIASGTWTEKPLNYKDFPTFEIEEEKDAPETVWQKFNPYHSNATGRFTSGAGVASGLMQSLTANEGFTYQPTFSKSPKSGLALSIYPERAAILDAKSIKGSDIKDYIAKNKDILADRSNYVGAWWDKASGRVFLDISKVVSTDAEAKALCEQHGQRAYFNLKTFDTVQVLSESEAHH